MMGDLSSIQQLECFIIYGRVQNFTRAAKEANITQSAFSAQMKNLESALGVTLIQRSKRGSHLTEAGKVFLARIMDWMDGLHKIVYDLQSANAAQPAELNVGILRTLGDIQVNRHIAHFRQTNKNLRFNVFDLETDQICRALQDDRLDVASTYYVADSLPAGGAAEYETAHFCWDNLVYYAPLLQPRVMPVTREAIARLPIVIYPEELLHEQDVPRVLRARPREGNARHFGAPLDALRDGLLLPAEWGGSALAGAPAAHTRLPRRLVRARAAAARRRLPHLQEEQPQDRPNPRLRQPRLAEL